MDLKKKKNGEEVCYVEVVRLRVEKRKEKKKEVLWLYMPP